MKILSAEEQKRIIETTPAAFEQLALLWRNYTPEGAKPDLGKAVLSVLCNHYFSESSFGYHRDDFLARFISYLLAEVKEGEPPKTALEEVDSHIRHKLKNLISGIDPFVINNPTPGGWIWDAESWLWQLSLHDAAQGGYRGHISISPLKNGRYFDRPILPEADHDQWEIEFMIPFKGDDEVLPEKDRKRVAIDYVLRLISGAEPPKDPFSVPKLLHRLFHPLTIPLKGSLDQVKHQLDLLLGVNTPPLPEATEYSVD